MITNMNFYPQDTSPCYFAVPGEGYAFWWAEGAQTPPVYLKIHISASAESIGNALGIAESVLPVLRRWKVHHKVVKDYLQLKQQESGKQAGKFIVMFPDVRMDHSALVAEIASALADTEYSPSVHVPRLRSTGWQIPERSLHQNGFLWGGFAETYTQRE